MRLTGYIRSLPVVMSLVLCHPSGSMSYGLLAHEAIVDATWDKSIKPLLILKYPRATEDDLKKARAYVYGGAIIPDIGYYPLGSHLFSNLVHYVRSGDFITALFDEAHTLNEYAFALGALSHYEADNYGHSLGTNKAVAIMFPKLRKKYGREVTYEQARDQHVRMEFGFDVLQTARGNYASNAYHDFIGFQVSDSVLERAFMKTYGIRFKDIFQSLPAAIAVFRFSVKVIMPELTKDAWKTRNSFITKLNPLATEKTYRYRFDKKNYRKEFSTPRVQSALVELIIGVLPKYGPLSRFKPMVPDPGSEKLFEHSFEEILIHYTATVNKLGSKDASFSNIDLDTDKETIMGEYRLADETYYQLLMNQKRNKFANMDKDLKKNIIAYYSKRDASPDYGVKTHKGKKVTKALEKLQAAPGNLTLND